MGFEVYRYLGYYTGYNFIIGGLIYEKQWGNRIVRPHLTSQEGAGYGCDCCKDLVLRLGCMGSYFGRNDRTGRVATTVAKLCSPPNIQK